MHSRRGSKLKARHYTFIRHYSFFIRGVSKIPYYGPKIRRRYNLGRHRKIIRILTPLFDEVLQDTHLNLEDRKNNRLVLPRYCLVFGGRGRSRLLVCPRNAIKVC